MRLLGIGGASPPPPQDTDAVRRQEAEQRQREGDARMAWLRAEAAVVLRKLEVHDDPDG